MAKVSDTKQIIDRLKKLYKTDVISGKGGFHVKGHGFVTLAKARKLTGAKAKSRETGRILPWGDYATIAMLNQPRSKKK